MPGVKGRSGGRNRLPTEAKKLRGTLRPSRTNAHEPRPSLQLPDPPAWLARAEKRHYRRLGKIVLRIRVMTESDGETLALAARALEELIAAEKIIARDGAVLTRETEKGTSVYRHPATILRDSAWRRYRDALRAFGLDPQSRGAVSAAPEEDEDLGEGYFQ